MRVFIREKITDFVIPVFPHLWQTKRGVRQAGKEASMAV
jgi:hypothetical protein